MILCSGRLPATPGTSAANKAPTGAPDSATPSTVYSYTIAYYSVLRALQELNFILASGELSKHWHLQTYAPKKTRSMHARRPKGPHTMTVTTHHRFHEAYHPRAH